MKRKIFGVASDLGLVKDGTNIGAEILTNEIKKDFDGEVEIFYKDKNIIKETSKDNLRKNELEIEKYNSNIYKNILDKVKDDYFPIMIGGDHSIAVASCLAVQKVYKDIGVIWVDAHTDYNTFRTTETGNIHGLPLAAITGYENQELRRFHDGDTVNPHNTVVVGARSIDKEEMNNVKDSGITVFTTNDIKEQGFEAIMDKAFKIALNGTKGIHISYDMDVIDPVIAPGVSVPEENGISYNDAININNYICDNIDKVLSYDLVEYNPLLDKDNKTKEIGIEILKNILKHTN